VFVNDEFGRTWKKESYQIGRSPDQDSDLTSTEYEPRVNALYFDFRF